MNNSISVLAAPALQVRRQLDVTVPADEGKIIRAFGDEMILKLSGEQTQGAFTLWENITPPGGGPPAHYHLDEDELFMVQEGTMRFQLNGAWRYAGPGSVLFAPRGCVHKFRNVGVTPSRMLVMTQPSGFEVFFARCAEEFERSEGPDLERITAISEEHGIHYVKEAYETRAAYSAHFI